MPSFRVHFATEPHEPFPPLDELPEVEAAEPLDAVHQLVETGRHPQNRPLNWARVVLNTHDDGKRQTRMVTAARRLYELPS
jgi:hypothetical protein